MKNILTLNSISPVINDIFTADYNVASDATSPVGIMLRSFKMHDYALDKETVAIARAGAGTNNIPVEEYAKQGVVVFNTPGANANSVKELVVAALMLGSRKITNAIEWVNTLKGKGDEVGKLVEKGKSAFGGREVLGKKIGIIGLGAIGALVADAALGLGMKVVGYDPYLSVNAALKLSRQVSVVRDIKEIYTECDYITIHIPYIASQNKDMINADVLSMMKDGVVIINCARGEIVNTADMIEATKSGKVGRYVVDFPSDDIIGVDNIVCIPHLGASTEEAEDNCAIMAAKQLIDYVENGNIVNSVNYPNCSMPRNAKCRIVVLHKNIQNIIASITSAISAINVNIENMTNQSKGDYAATIVDTNDTLSQAVIDKITAVNGVIRVRVI